MSKRKNGKPEKPAPDQTIRNSILAAVAELLDRHMSRIREAREQGAEAKGRVTFAVVIDETEAEPIVQTQIAYGVRVTDSMTARLDDPNQGAFRFADADEAARDAAGVDYATAELPKRKRGAVPAESEGAE